MGVLSENLAGSVSRRCRGYPVPVNSRRASVASTRAPDRPVAVWAEGAAGGDAGDGAGRDEGMDGATGAGVVDAPDCKCALVRWV